jgi:hypothetical protein
VRAGQATLDEVQEYQRIARDEIRVGEWRDQYIERLIEAALGVLTPDQASTLTILINNARWNVPIEYRVVRRTEREWLQLESALILERQSRDSGNPPSPELIATLASARAGPLVRQAIDHLNEQNMTTVAEAFAEAVDHHSR